jgi:hypothetical protein
MNHIYDFQTIQAGGILILTLQSNDSIKFLFKVTSVLPPYIVNSMIHAYTFSVLYTWGSQYIPRENCDDFYIDFGTVDTMPHHSGNHNSYIIPTSQQQCLNMIPYSPTAFPSRVCNPPPTCGCHPSHQPSNCHPLTPAQGEVLDTYSSTGSFLYTYDNNYNGVTNPVLTDIAPGTFRINGGALDSSSFIQVSVSDSSINPTNTANYFTGMSAGSTICFYNISTGKRCIFKLTSISSQATSSVSTAAQTSATLTASYLFRVIPVATNYGITPVQGDKYIVTFTISASISTTIAQTIVQDLLPATGNTVTLGSFERAFKDIFIGPNSLWISSFQLGINSNTGYPALIHSTVGAFTFDFYTALSTLSTLSSYVTGPVGTGGGGGGGVTVTFDMSTITTVPGSTSYGVSARISTVGGYLGGLGIASNVSTAVSILGTNAAGNGYVLTKSGAGTFGWAAAAAGGGGASVTFDMSTISTLNGGLSYSVSPAISTAGAYLGSATTASNLSSFLGNTPVASNTSTAVSILGTTAGGSGYVLTKSGAGAFGWAAAAAGGGGASVTFDMSTISTLNNGVSYSVSPAISTAGAYLGSATTASNLSSFLGNTPVASNTSTAVSIIGNNTAVTGHVLTKLGSGYGWAAAAGGGGGASVTFDMSTISTLNNGLSYSVSPAISTAGGYLGSAITASNLSSFLGNTPVASNLSTAGSILGTTAGGSGYVLTKSGAGAFGWAPAAGGGGGASVTFDMSTISTLNNGVSYSVSPAISTAGGYLGNVTVASNVSTAGSILGNNTAVTGYVLTKAGSGYGWAPAAGGGGGSVTFDMSTISTLNNGVSYSVSPAISTAGGYLGNVTVASNTSTSVSILGTTAGGSGYVLTKSGAGAFGWAAASGGGGGTSRTTAIMINLVFSNTNPSPKSWTDGAIVLNSNLMVSCNAANLPAGWQLVMSNSTPVGISISTSGALNYNANQMIPVNARLIYARTVAGGNTTVPNPVSWVSVGIMDATYSGPSARNGIYGTIVCTNVLEGLDANSLFSVLSGFTANTPSIGAGQPTNVQNTLPNFWIPGNSNAILAKLYFEFNTGTGV